MPWPTCPAWPGIDTAIAEAVRGLRGGYSWAEIVARLGITRQAAQQRWGSIVLTR